MGFDALTLSAVRDELEPLLVDARMQRVVFVDELSLGLECFRPGAGRTNVLLAADLEDSRVQRLPELPPRGLESESPFSLLIRKHLRNARIVAIHQPLLERVLELDCEQRDASNRLYKVALIVEAMGRRSNLVLVDQDRSILDSARRAPPGRNPRRPLLPHLPYLPPPPQDLLTPDMLSAESLAPPPGSPQPADLPSLAKYLRERIAGLSPLAARELAYRTGAAQDLDWDHVAVLVRAFLGIVDTHTWEPCVAFDVQQPIDYAPYVLTHLQADGATIQPFDSMSDAIQAFYARRGAAPPTRRGDAFAAQRKALFAPLERATHATQRRIAALEFQLATGHHEREPLRRAGEAILTHQSELPIGTTELVVDGERFELDPRLSAVDNAQAYFARYRKARETEARVPALLEEARRTAEHLADLQALVEVADQMDAVRALRREVASATRSQARAQGQAQAARPRQARSKPGSEARGGPYRRVPLGDGWEALVGVSAEGNATVTFDVAGADDLWLHARGLPGAHVVVRARGGTPPEPIIEMAAQVAAAHSPARTASAVEVDVTSRRYVKKIPGGAPGLVRYTNERTLRVAPRLH
jgi:predicted ribosome quality control (RQC) complex YloA/Tae2 family protein